MLRYFAVGEDFSLEPMDTCCPRPSSRARNPPPSAPSPAAGGRCFITTRCWRLCQARDWLRETGEGASRAVRRRRPGNVAVPLHPAI
jgi:hypothetical protein